MYRTDINQPVPTDKLYDVEHDTTIPRRDYSFFQRETSIVLYDRIWNGRFLTDYEPQRYAEVIEVYIPIATRYFPVAVRNAAAADEATGEIASYTLTDPVMRGGDLIDMNAGDGNAIKPFTTYLEKEFKKRLNMDFFRPRANTKFLVSVAYTAITDNEAGNTGVAEWGQLDGGFAVWKRLSSPFLSHIGDWKERRQGQTINHKGALHVLTEKLDQARQSQSNYAEMFVMTDIRVMRTTLREDGVGQGGSVFRSLQQVGKVFVRPFVLSRTNCLYTASFIAKKAQSNPEILLENEQKHNKGGENLKGALRRQGYADVHDDYSNFDTIKSIAVYYRLPFVIYNNTFQRIFEYSPYKLRKFAVRKNQIELMLANQHYTPLIRKSSVPQSILDQLVARDEALKGLEFEGDNAAKGMRRDRVHIYESLAQDKPVLIEPRCKQLEKRRKAMDIYVKGAGEQSTIALEFDKTKIVAWDLETAPIRISDDVPVDDHVRDEYTVHKAYMSGLAWYDPTTQEQLVAQFCGMDCIQQFLSFVHARLDVFNGCTFYAHSGGRFDLPILMREGLFSDNWTFGRYKSAPFRIVAKKAMELNGSWVSFALEEKLEEGSKRKKPRYIMFRDSFRLLPSSLDKLCKDFNTLHKKLGGVDHNLVTIDNYFTQPLLDQLKKYHENDCRSLLEVVVKFGQECQRDYRVNITGTITVASVAKQAFWKNWAPPEGTDVYTLGYKMDDFVRKSYFGGRVECFELGALHERFPDEKWYYFDYTSLYPYVCTKELPVGMPQWVNKDEIWTLDGKIRPDFYGFVTVHVRTDLASHLIHKFKPMFAVVNQGRLCFPWLKEWIPLILFSEEIRYAQQIGMPYEYDLTDKPTYGLRFQSYPLLRNMINVCYEKKREASIQKNEAKRLITKLLLNSSYGFWGLRVRNRDSVIVVDSKDGGTTFRKYYDSDRLIGSGTHRIGPDTYEFLRVFRDLDTLDFNVAVASAVTSLARIQLHTSMCDIMDKGYKVVYCDTDSMITTCPMGSFPDMVQKYMSFHDGSRDWNGEQLGNLKNECEDLCHGCLDEQRLHDDNNVYFDKCYIAGCKMYSVAKTLVNGKTVEINKCKGYSKRDAKLTGSDFERLISQQTKVDQLRTELLNKRCTIEQFRSRLKALVIHQMQTQFRIGKSDFVREGARTCTVEVRPVEKFFRINYTKGQVSENGTVKPLEVLNTDIVHDDLHYEQMLQTLIQEDPSYDGDQLEVLMEVDEANNEERAFLPMDPHPESLDMLLEDEQSTIGFFDEDVDVSVP